MSNDPASQSALVPGLDPVAAARWRLLDRAASPWLHEEIGARMADRLGWIKQPPASWLDWSPLLGGLDAHRLVARHYPGAAAWLAGEQTSTALAALGGGWRAGLKNPLKWLQAPGLRVADAQHPEPVEMLWANMALHQTPDPKALLALWRNALKVGGFLMFSCLGPDTLKELRAVFEVCGWPAPAHDHTDMHDWGDMLVELGFAEPVMDMERIQLTYPSAERLLQDLREMGRNLNAARFPALRGRGHRGALLQALETRLPRTADGQLLLTVEVVYGHAYKAVPRVKLASASTVSVDDMRAMLRQPGAGGRDNPPK